jgi:geranylgeranyl diphosphate synthase type II
MLPRYLSQVKKLVKDKMLKSIGNNNKIEEAMAYSALADSKMIRAGLVFASSETNKNIAKESIITLSSAVELMHTYSLIHDDIPCMDDDDLRRNQPSSHIKYGEANAVLAGDALQALSYEIIVDDIFLSSDDKVNAINLLSKACGKNGMVFGQYLDVKNENHQNIDMQKLDDIHNLKTGKLIECAVMLGQTGSSLESESLNTLRDFSSKIGLAFQITDDILDVTQIESVLGKNKNSDAKNNKLTYIDIIGLDEAKVKVNKLTNSALNSLSQSNISNINKLVEMAKYLIDRES